MDVLLVLLIVLLVLTSLVAAGLLLARAGLRRANQVVQGRPSPAPVSWLVSPVAPARAHRALAAQARAVATMTPETGLDDRLSACAVRLDTRLVLAATLPPATRAAAVKAAVEDCRTFGNVVAHLLAETHPGLVETPPALEGGNDPVLAELVVAARLRAEAFDELDNHTRGQARPAGGSGRAQPTTRQPVPNKARQRGRVGLRRQQGQSNS
jgi:hypothetical protein